MVADERISSDEKIIQLLKDKALTEICPGKFIFSLIHRALHSFKSVPINTNNINITLRKTCRKK